MKRSIATGVICLMAVSICVAVGGDKAAYVGGTENQIKDNSEGVASVKDDTNFTFKSDHGSLKIPWTQVDDIEYGQKAGRRVGVAIMVTPLALFSKKRKHFLTVGWKDDQDKQHVAILELGKNIVRVTLATMEARTGKKVDYQDDEARKSGLGGLL